MFVVICKYEGCGKKRTTNSPKDVKVICWDDYQLCSFHCVMLHPERYPLNIVHQILGLKEEKRFIDKKSYIKKTGHKPIEYPKHCKECGEDSFTKGLCRKHYDLNRKKYIGKDNKK